MNSSTEVSEKIDILDRIKRGDILLSDGAIGSLILAKNITDLPFPEFLNLSHIDILEDIAAKYSDAGADIIQTNTFGASPLKLSDYNQENNSELINRNAVKAVKNSVRADVFVSASIGPSGKLLKPYGDTDKSEIYESYLKQASYLSEEGIDVICIETMTDINEALLALKASKEITPTTPSIVTMTFDKTKKGFYTVMGVSIEEASQKLEAAGADVIGSNCGNGIENMILIAEEFKRFSKLPIIIQSNAGIPEIDSNGKIFYRESPAFMSEKIKKLIEIGVSIIGGCCGTTPAHISAFRKVLNGLKC